MTQTVQTDIAVEITIATNRYGDYASVQEAYGVLAEEMAELLDAIHANASESVRAEAIQIAAVATRLAEHCRDHPAFSKRSGFKT